MTNAGVSGEAARRAGRLYASPGFRRVYIRGALAAAGGRPIEACPYRRGRAGWTAWGRAWRAGWRSIPAAGD